MGTLHGGFRDLTPRIEDLTAGVTFLNELGWNMSWGEAGPLVATDTRRPLGRALA